MNDRDILNAARRAQEAATKREPPSDIETAKSDICRLADVMSQMLDLHDRLDARLTRPENALLTIRIAPLH
jgi:hypothetical protein